MLSLEPLDHGGGGGCTPYHYRLQALQAAILFGAVLQQASTYGGHGGGVGDLEV